MRGELIYTGGKLAFTTATTQLGGKAANLLRLMENGYNVPPFYVITVDAFRLALRLAGLETPPDSTFAGPANGSHDPAWYQQAGQVLERRDLPAELVQAVHAAHHRMFPNETRFAVRSSAIDEDGTRHSFAGMHDSVLDVCGIAEVMDALRRVWASACSERALAYRGHWGLQHGTIAMAVIVQRMIEATRSGVALTCNPAEADAEQVVISATAGSGERLVSGQVSGDTYRVRKSTPRGARSGENDSTSPVTGHANRILFSSDGTREGQQPTALRDAEVNQVAQAVIAIERLFGGPLDVEFCFDRTGTLWILQARPVTSGPFHHHARDPHRIWDNSNIIESYSGVTSPMTFSFIRRAYAIVYHCFAEVMGISPRQIRTHREAFENMLGLFHGRVYYNLKNWYKLLRLFPGYRFNRRFMESMMGVKQGLDLEDQSPEPNPLRRWLVEFPALAGLVIRFLWSFLRIRRTVARFENHFERHYHPWSKTDFNRMEPHELMGLYRQMEDALLWNWKAPIINDFFVMVFYGTLRAMCVNWCDDVSGTLQNALLCGEGGLESAEPAKRLVRMAHLAATDPVLRERILLEPVESLVKSMPDDSRFARFNELMDQYLEIYGLRCPGELKLEEPSFRDRPHLVYQMLRNYLQLDDPSLLDVETSEAREQSVRAEAERQVRDKLAWGPSRLPRRTVFSWVLRNARMGIRHRENMRLARTRVFGLFREMLRSLGRQLADEGILESSGDIFYLTIDEVRDFIQGTAVSTDLRGLVHLRKREFARYRDRATEAPPDRFDTYGMPYCGKVFHEAEPTRKEEIGLLRGLGCSPGTVTGTACVVRDPATRPETSGDILVAQRTDPGWVTIFPAFRGILIERGSPLSHSAIVARELAIPTIVGVDGLTQRIRSGQRIRMDGRRGTVEILPSGPPESVERSRQEARTAHVTSST